MGLGRDYVVGTADGRAMMARKQKEILEEFEPNLRKGKGKGAAAWAGGHGDLEGPWRPWIALLRRLGLDRRCRYALWEKASA